MTLKPLINAIVMGWRKLCGPQGSWQESGIRHLSSGALPAWAIKIVWKVLESELGATGVSQARAQLRVILEKPGKGLEKLFKSGVFQPDWLSGMAIDEAAGFKNLEFAAKCAAENGLGRGIEIADVMDWLSLCEYNDETRGLFDGLWKRLNDHADSGAKERCVLRLFRNARSGGWFPLAGVRLEEARGAFDWRWLEGIQANESEANILMSCLGHPQDADAQGMVRSLINLGFCEAAVTYCQKFGIAKLPTQAWMELVKADQFECLNALYLRQMSIGQGTLDRNELIRLRDYAATERSFQSLAWLRGVLGDHG